MWCVLFIKELSLEQGNCFTSTSTTVTSQITDLAVNMLVKEEAKERTSYPYLEHENIL